MQQRAVLPVLPALMIGFVCGLIGAALQLNTGPLVLLGVVGAIAVIALSTTTVLGIDAPKDERVIVGGLRAIAAALLFVLTYLALLALLQDAKIGMFLVLAVLAIAVAILLTRFRVRDADADAAQS